VCRRPVARVAFRAQALVLLLARSVDTDLGQWLWRWSSAEQSPPVAAPHPPPPQASVPGSVFSATEPRVDVEQVVPAWGRFLYNAAADQTRVVFVDRTILTKRGAHVTFTLNTGASLLGTVQFLEKHHNDVR
jgi:hypothetical protein